MKHTVFVGADVVTVLFAVHALWILFWLGASARVLSRSVNGNLGFGERGALPNVIVLLPALREQRLVLETLTTFSAIDYPGLLVPIAITTERETRERAVQFAALDSLAAELLDMDSPRSRRRALAGALPPSMLTQALERLDRTDPGGWPSLLKELFESTPTTAELCAKTVAEVNALPGRHRCIHIHCPSEAGRKGTQLNFAVEHLSDLVPAAASHPDLTYLAVYDFDAVPHPLTFTAFGAEVLDRRRQRRDLPAIYQQVQLPLRVRMSFARNLDGLLMRGQVLYWLRRAMAVEVGRLLQARIVRSCSRRMPRAVRALCRPMIYTIGSGMFVRLDAMKSLGPFDEMQETIGHRASLLDYEQTLITNFNVTEPYYTVKSMMNGWANVCYGSLGVLNEPGRLRKYRSPLHSYEQWVLVYKELFDIFIWLAGVIIIPSALVLSSLSETGWLAFTCATVILAYPVTAILLLSILSQLDFLAGPELSDGWSGGFLARLVLVLTFAAGPFVSAIGPWKMLRRLLAVRRSGGDVLSGKTER